MAWSVLKSLARVCWTVRKSLALGVMRVRAPARCHFLRHRLWRAEGLRSLRVPYLHSLESSVGSVPWVVW